MKTVIYGIHGKMGSLLAEHILKDNRFDLIGGVDPLVEKPFGNVPTFKILNQLQIPEVIIDFSHASQLSNILSYAVENKVALVIATTGHNEAQRELIKEASSEVPIFYSANMSFGVHILRQILKQITRSLEEDFDIEIIEKHHHHKVDAPSGTANLLAEEILKSSEKTYKYVHGRSGQVGKRTKEEIGIHAVRGGSIVGEHTVIFAGDDEVIELTHKAESKAVFVHGAMKAALFIQSQAPGLYNMDDLTRKN